MRPLLPLVVFAALAFAGCGAPSHPAPMPEASETPTPTVPPTQYSATIVVTREIPSGEPVRTQVTGIPLLADGSLGIPLARGTDAQGAARFLFDRPTTLLVRATGPEGWTTEGARVHIDAAVAAEGLTVSDRDVFLPLYRSELAFAAEQTLSTAVAQPRPDGGVEPTLAFHALAFPEGLQAAYLARLSSANVQATWVDDADGRALNASVGLAWGDAVWVEGAGAPLTQVGPRSASWEGALPGAGRPSDLSGATLQTVLLTRTAVVGEVLVDVQATLGFGGRLPAGLPVDDCHLLC
jgi:hypothetical protein